MTCRHGVGDPNCSSYPAYKAQVDKENQAKVDAEIAARTPNPEDYEILEAEMHGGNLVLKVRYSSCKKCSYDAQKVMVFLGVDMVSALKWRRIDPHFSDDSKKSRLVTEAPSPAARFPASKKGWTDAKRYACNEKQPVYRGEERGGPDDR